METVELLVDCFYQFEERAEKERLEKEQEELDKISELGEEERTEMMAAAGAKLGASNG